MAKIVGKGVANADKAKFCFSTATDGDKRAKATGKLFDMSAMGEMRGAP